MAGRGFGKTRAGAEWVRALAASDQGARIALVAASLVEARSVMVEGESGVLAVCERAGERPRYFPSLRRLDWPSGATAALYSAAEPESLRGPQHSHGWCDEIAKWDNSGARATRAWDNLMMGMRLGIDPRILATTTPRPVVLVQQLIADPATALTRGRTLDNAANMPAKWLADMQRRYGGSNLGRQELDGELLTEQQGALWSRALLERCRAPAPAPAHLQRVVIGVDPPATSRGDACGIVAVGLGPDERAFVLGDHSVTHASPDRWAEAVSVAATQWSAERVVAEANQGGDMVETVLRAVQRSLPLRLVHASRGKAARAEPVAALYEADRVRHCGTFGPLEDELTALMPGGGYEGPGRSPDRADALVWALTELMLGKAGQARIR